MSYSIFLHPSVFWGFFILNFCHFRIFSLFFLNHLDSSCVSQNGYFSSCFHFHSLLVSLRIQILALLLPSYIASLTGSIFSGLNSGYTDSQSISSCSFHYSCTCNLFWCSLFPYLFYCCITVAAAAATLLSLLS